jgi:hypothetical protein
VRGPVKTLGKMACFRIAGDWIELIDEGGVVVPQLQAVALR